MRQFLSNLLISKKITLLLLSVVSICLLVSGFCTYLSMFTNVENMLGQKLNHIAATGSMLINPEDHDKIEKALAGQDANITDKDFFKRVQKTLRDIKNKNKLKEDIYTVIAPDWAEGNMIFIAMSNEKTYVGNSLKAREEVLTALSTGQPQYSKIYSDSEGVWVSAFAPIVNAEGKATAVIEVDYHAESEIAEAKKDLFKSIFLPGLGALCLSLLLGNFIGKVFTRPIFKLGQAAALISAGQLDVHIENTSQDEIGSLSRVFNLMVSDLKISKEKLQEYANNLEIKVEERTAKLAAATKANIALLNNLQQGFMVIDNEGVVEPGSTKAATEFFMADPAGRFFHEILQVESSKVENIKSWIELCFADLIPFETLIEIGPKSFEKDPNRFLQLSYRPIYNKDEKIEKIICIAEDKTNERFLEQQALEEKEFTNFILAVINDPNEFRKFVKLALSRLHDLDQEIKTFKKFDELDIDSMLRHFHTLKGEAGFYHIPKVREKAHEIEGSISKISLAGITMHFSEMQKLLSEQIREIGLELTAFVEKNKTIVGSLDEGEVTSKAVSAQNLSLLNSELKKSLPQNSKAYQLFAENFLIEDLSNSFDKYKKLVSDLAMQKGKKIELSIEKGKVLVSTDEFKPLISSCVHLFRNVVDHGIESTEDRDVSGKPALAKVQLKFDQFEKQSQQWIRLSLQDDGKGINPQIIKEKLIEKNLLSEQQLAPLSDEEIIQMIFLPRFSSLDNVTTLSGRGVGLDSINNEVKSLGGTVRVESILGQGTQFIIEIPLSDTMLARAS